MGEKVITPKIKESKKNEILLRRVTTSLYSINYLLTPKRYAKDIRNLPLTEFI